MTTGSRKSTRKNLKCFEEIKLYESIFCSIILLFWNPIKELNRNGRKKFINFIASTHREFYICLIPLKYSTFEPHFTLYTPPHPYLVATQKHLCVSVQLQSSDTKIISHLSSVIQSPHNRAVNIILKSSKLAQKSLFYLISA